VTASQLSKMNHPRTKRLHPVGRSFYSVEFGRHLVPFSIERPISMSGESLAKQRHAEARCLAKFDSSEGSYSARQAALTSEMAIRSNTNTEPPRIRSAQMVFSSTDASGMMLFMNQLDRPA
jgi:hypothetical protein